MIPSLKWSKKWVNTLFKNPNTAAPSPPSPFYTYNMLRSFTLSLCVLCVSVGVAAEPVVNTLEASGCVAGGVSQVLYVGSVVYSFGGCGVAVHTRTEVSHDADEEKDTTQLSPGTHILHSIPGAVIGEYHGSESTPPQWMALIDSTLAIACGGPIYIIDVSDPLEPTIQKVLKWENNNVFGLHFTTSSAGTLLFATNYPSNESPGEVITFHENSFTSTTTLYAQLDLGGDTSPLMGIAAFSAGTLYYYRDSSVFAWDNVTTTPSTEPREVTTVVSHLFEWSPLVSNGDLVGYGGSELCLLDADGGEDCSGLDKAISRAWVFGSNMLFTQSEGTPSFIDLSILQESSNVTTARSSSPSTVAGDSMFSADLRYLNNATDVENSVLSYLSVEDSVAVATLSEVTRTGADVSTLSVGIPHLPQSGCVVHHSAGNTTYAVGGGVVQVYDMTTTTSMLLSHLRFAFPGGVRACHVSGDGDEALLYVIENGVNGQTTTLHSFSTTEGATVIAPLPASAALPVQCTDGSRVCNMLFTTDNTDATPTTLLFIGIQGLTQDPQTVSHTVISYELAGTNLTVLSESTVDSSGTCGIRFASFTKGRIVSYDCVLFLDENFAVSSVVPLPQNDTAPYRAICAAGDSVYAVQDHSIQVFSIAEGGDVAVIGGAALPPSPRLAEDSNVRGAGCAVEAADEPRLFVSYEGSNLIRSLRSADDVSTLRYPNGPPLEIKSSGFHVFLPNNSLESSYEVAALLSEGSPFVVSNTAGYIATDAGLRTVVFTAKEGTAETAVPDTESPQVGPGTTEAPKTEDTATPGGNVTDPTPAPVRELAADSDDGDDKTLLAIIIVALVVGIVLTAGFVKFVCMKKKNRIPTGDSGGKTEGALGRGAEAPTNPFDDVEMRNV